MPIISNGAVPVGEELTAMDQAVLDALYLTYNPTKLVSRYPFVTTEDSLYLGGIHSISSGNDNVFFKNYEHDINYYPMWGGVKDQSLRENQNGDGIIQPFGRTYSDSMYSSPLTGLPEADPITYKDRLGTVKLPFDLSVYGMNFRHEHQITIGTELILSIHVGEDTTGLVVYRDEKVITEFLPPANSITWWFAHPLEGKVDSTYFVDISFANDSERILSVSQDTGGLGYVTAFFRFFVDKDLAFKEDIDAISDFSLNIVTTANEAVSGYNLTNFYGHALPNQSSVIIDNNGDVITHE